MLQELRERGYINVYWADDVPYYLTLNNSARTYKKQRSEHETQKAVYSSQKKKVSSIIFISHRSTDKAIADMLLDFFSGTGIPRETVFCSSLPGNDINEKISGEVKAALKSSVVNIAILSNGYYQSAYCLNEGGILWYLEDIPVIPIGLPEIDSRNMYGFLSGGNRIDTIRHLLIFHLLNFVRLLSGDRKIFFIEFAILSIVLIPYKHPFAVFKK